MKRVIGIQRRDAESFPIVVIGGSTGRVGALEDLLPALPDRFGFAIVFMPLPSAKGGYPISRLFHSRKTVFSFEEAAHGIRLLPGHLYLCPPTRRVRVEGGSFRVADRSGSDARPLLDDLLSSLAWDAPKRTVAVFLSGPGSDGVQGARMLKKRGGIILVQDPAYAQCPRMPLSVIEAGQADGILSPHEIAGELLRICHGTAKAVPTDNDTAELVHTRSDQNISAILDNISDGFVTMDNKWYITHANKAALAHFRKIRKETVGRSFFDLFPNARGTIIETRWIQALKTGKPTHFEAASIVSDKFMEVHAYPGPGNMTILFRDITERIRTEQTQRHLASFPELNPNPVMEVDTLGNLMFCNPSTYRILEELGMAREEAGTFLPEDLQAILGKWDRKTALVLSREVVVRDRVFDTSVHLVPEFQVVRIYARDITGLKLAEAGLRESEKQVRAKLESILAPEGELGNLELSDIIDVSAFQLLLDQFHRLIPVPTAIVDLKGVVLVSTGWQKICVAFHRLNPETCAHCVESDLTLSAGIPPGESKLYRCKNGIWDMATPIMIGGQHMGNIFLGQFFFEDEKIDYEFFRSQAGRYGFDEDAYMGALEAVPRLTRDTVDASMAFLMQLTQIFSRLSFGHIKLAHSVAQGEALSESLKQREEQLNLFVRHAPAAIAMFDKEMRYLAVSNRWRSDYNIGRQDLIGRSHYELFPGIPERWREIHRRCLTGVVERAEEDRVERAGGTVQWIKWEVHPWYLPSGPVGGIIIFSEDITKRKLAEEKIRTQNRLMEGINRVLFESITCETEENLGRVCLSVAEDLTESTTGFIGRMQADGLPHDIVVDRFAWGSYGTISKQGYPNPPDGIVIRGHYSQALRNGESLLINDPSSHSDGIVIPEDHPSLTAFLGIPLVLADKTVGLFALANRAGGYSQEQQIMLEMLAPVVLQTLLKKCDEERIARLSKLYAILSQVNEMIIRTHDMDALFEGVCRIVAEEGDFPLVWFGMVEEEEVLPVASRGPAADYLREINVEIKGTLGSGPTGTCIRENRSVVNDSFAANPAMLPWRETALRYGFQASAAFPLRRQGKLVGVFTIYASKPNAFDAEQMGLLESLSADLSYALETLSLEKLRVYNEEELREIKEMWERTFASVPDLIAIVDNDHRVVRVNEAMAQRLSLNTEECDGMFCYEAVHGLSEPPWFCPHSRTLSDQCKHTEEIHDDRLGGFFEVTTTPIYDDQNHMVGSVHVAHDITERKFAETEQQTSTEFLRLINESSDKKGLIHSALVFFRRLSGCEAVGLRLQEGDDYPYYETWGFPPEFELQENRLCVLDQTGAVVLDPEGQPVLACICGDVIRRHPDILKPFFTEKGSFWTNCISELPIVSNDGEGLTGTGNRCREEGFESVALIPLRIGDECLGLLQLNHRRKGQFTEYGITLWERLAGHLAVALAKFQAEESLKRAHDELEERVRQRTLELSEAYETLQTEVEERKKAEEQLRQAHKMEAIGTFAGGIAHDFNNILASVLGFTEMAVEDIPDRPDVVRNLQHVLKSATRARELVKQLLAFSRKAEHTRTPLALGPLIKETVRMLRASIPSTIAISVTTKAQPDTILASPVEIQQILMNLAGNAVHAMPEQKGSIEITLGDIDVPLDSSLLDDDDKQREYLELTVRDTGTGMTPAVMKRIFEPFFTTREVGKGTGMGLAVVYGIVQDLRGTITVESEIGSGSLFRIILPKIRAEVEAEPAQIPKAPSGKENILFVDDEDFIAEWGKEALSRLGYNTTSTTDSTGALELFLTDSSRFDLVITDQTMPGMTGMQLARELLMVRPDIPIILCTGHTETITEKEAKRAGIREFLMKPISRTQLAETIRRILDAGR